jgi:NADP-dependent aldehyde dehydrogenase
VSGETSAVDFERILSAAQACAPALADTSPTVRAGWLNAVAAALDARTDDLVQLARVESHLPEARLRGELVRTTFQLRLFADEVREGGYLAATIDTADPDWPMGARPDLRRTMRPIGPVAVYAASNFPFAFSVAGGDTASAIAAGAPVVVKANPGHPQLSALTAEIVRAALGAAGAPDGTFDIVFGLETGRRLVVDARITAASFTGSLAGGRALFDLAVGRDHPIPFYGELGSINPAFATPLAAEARAEEIITGFLGSVALGVGQFCTKPGLLLLPASVDFAPVVRRVVDAVPPAPMLGDHIREGYLRVLHSLAGHPAVRTVAGGRSGEGGGDGDAQAPIILTTTAAELLANADQLMVECFGPTAIVVTYTNPSDLFAVAGAIDGQLTATVLGETDDEVAARLVTMLAGSVGRVLWNGWPTGVSVTYAMQHGGPYPATTSPTTTSVGMAAIERFLRPVAYQGVPQEVLPPQLRDDNPWSVPQRVDGVRRPR